VWDLDPRQRVLEAFDLWVNPDQVAHEDNEGFVAYDCEVDDAEEEDVEEAD
jgi:hypothetical protein